MWEVRDEVKGGSPVVGTWKFLPDAFWAASFHFYECWEKHSAPVHRTRGSLEKRGRNRSRHWGLGFREGNEQVQEGHLGNEGNLAPVKSLDLQFCYGESQLGKGCWRKKRCSKYDWGSTSRRELDPSLGVLMWPVHTMSFILCYDLFGIWTWAMDSV